jgi:UPF0755 protein
MWLERLRRRYKRRYPVVGRHKRSLPKALRYGIATLVLALLALGTYVYWFSVTRLEPEAKIYVVEPGTGLKAFARQLSRERVLPDAHTLVWIAYLKGQSRELKAGEYRFRRGITALEILDQVIAGRVVEYPLTILEGWNFKQLLETLAAAPKLTHSLQGLKPKQIMAMLGYPTLHPEGRFYPDTYYYSAGMSDLLILQRAFQAMEKVLDEEWENRSSDLPIKTRDEALTLASIVEKETGKAEERALIAGVFVHRMRIGMKLQTDPTVIYGLGDKFAGNLTVAHLRQYTPYNTYVIKGLPPTPIAMPGREALRAALHPEGTKALFFVSRGDGSHEFSETLEEHNRAVVKYQLKGQPKPAPAAKPRSAAGRQTAASPVTRTP